MSRADAALTAAELRRYGRHMVMPEVGREGQQRLVASSVLIVGAGGLGSPAALYLAAAGVGRLGLVDFDIVEESNLQRQVLYGQADVGQPKLAAARRRLSDVNPLIEVITHEEKLTSANALAILDGYDVVVDGSDNFATRYLVNDACVLMGKPDVYGSIFRFEGQVSVFWGERGPCYRCLFPQPPPPGLVPSCAEAGVLGVLPGVVGSLQASEAVKLVLGIGEPLIGRLVVFDALDTGFRELRLAKSADCPVCGEAPTQTELIDYDQFCGVAMTPDGEKDPPSMEDGVQADFDITGTELKEWLDSERDFALVDVRTPPEFDIARIDGSRLMPLNQLAQRLDELDPSADIVVYCHHGPRSTRAVAYLRANGFANARNLSGGIDAWSRQVDPAVPLY